MPRSAIGFRLWPARAIGHSAKDILLAQGADSVFADLAASQTLVPNAHPHGLQPDFASIEAVVMPESTVVGSRIASLEAFRTAASPFQHCRCVLPVSKDVLRISSFTATYWCWRARKRVIAEALEEVNACPCFRSALPRIAGLHGSLLQSLPAALSLPPSAYAYRIDQPITPPTDRYAIASPTGGGIRPPGPRTIPTPRPTGSCTRPASR